MSNNSGCSGCLGLLAQILVRLAMLQSISEGETPKVYYTTDGNIIFGLPEAKKHDGKSERDKSGDS